MKIKYLETFTVDAGWRPWQFVKIETEDGIVGEDGAGAAQAPAEPQVDLAGIVPGAPGVRLFQPGLAVGLGFELTSGGPVVLRAGIPVAVIRLGGAGVHEGPGAQG